MRDSGYDELFPHYTVIVFDGCNVAADDGLDECFKFLSAVGGTWLRRAGGVTYGWTSSGYRLLDGWIPFVGDHTVHFCGNVLKLYFGPGGRMVDPP